VERPFERAGTYVVAADVSGRRLLVRRVHLGDGLHDDDVADDDRRRRRAEHGHFAIGQSFFQQHRAVPAERRIGLAGARVDRDQPAVERVAKQALLFAVGPVGEAAAAGIAWTPAREILRLGREHPQRLAGRRIDRGGLMHAGAHVQDAVDHDRRLLIVRVRTAPLDRQRLPAPGDHELLRVRCVDLIERGVARRAEIAAPGMPFAVAHAVLGRSGGARQQQQRCKAFAMHARSPSGRFVRASGHRFIREASADARDRAGRRSC
jgi:hypothetical protein